MIKRSTFTKSSFYFIFSSFIVFIILNFIENLIHYSIGRNSNENNIQFSRPTTIDWIRIIIIMIIFGFLQGFFSFLLDKYLENKK